MEKTTKNIIYLYNSIVDCVENFDGTIDEHSWLCIEIGYQPKGGEVFDVSIKQADFEDRNMYHLQELIALDDSIETLEKGIIRYYPIVSKVSPIIDDWFKNNK